MAIPRPSERFAFDRATVRNIDADGRLHVTVTNISKGNVCPYLGSEIPNAESLGLKPDTVYQLLRDPAELELAATTFNNLPLLSRHVPVSADDHQPGFVVGSTGTDAAWVAPYLQNSLVIWDAAAIAGVESGDQKELSSAYRYVPIMEPGVFDGAKYDGRMTQIVGNHVALVEAGRAGSDVVVGDAKMKEPTMANTKPSRAAKAAKMALDAVASGKLAVDANMEDLAALLEAFEDKAPVEDAAPDDVDPQDKGATAEDEDAETEEEKKARMEKRAADKAAKDAEMDDDKKDDGKKAMDAAITTLRAEMLAVREAERAVRPWVGEIAIAQDSAASVYKLALDTLGVDVAGVHPSAYAAILKVQPKPGDAPAPKRTLGMDAKAKTEFAAAFPSASRVKHV